MFYRSVLATFAFCAIAALSMLAAPLPARAADIVVQRITLWNDALMNCTLELSFNGHTFRSHELLYTQKETIDLSNIAGLNKLDYIDVNVSSLKPVRWTGDRVRYNKNGQTVVLQYKGTTARAWMEKL